MEAAAAWGPYNAAHYSCWFLLGGVGRNPGISFDARPAVVGHARAFRGGERVGHDLEALRGVQPHVGDDHVPGVKNGQAERVSETLGLKLEQGERDTRQDQKQTTNLTSLRSSGV